MRIGLLAIIGCLIMTSCKNNNSPEDIFRITDGVATYIDTIKNTNSGKVITRDVTLMVVTDSEKGYEQPMMLLGKHYHRDTCAVCNYSCSLHKTEHNALFSMVFKIHSEFSFAIKNAEGPANGIGTFRTKTGDSSFISEDGYPYLAGDEQPDDDTAKKALPALGKVINYFTLAPKYTTDSITVMITKDSATTINGKYCFWMSNGTDHKTLKGKFNCNTAKID